MSLVFYYAPMSTAVTVHWALEELGIPYEIVEIDLQARDQDKRGYRQLNPNGKVPLVVHDGVAIFESAAIMIHLGETFGVERGLFPGPGLERAEALKWLVWANVTLGEAVGRWLRSGQTDAGAKADVEERLGILNAELAEKTYLAGGEFSLVDVHLASFASWIGMIGLSLGPWPHLEAWLRRCTTRPKYGASLAA
jgi:glutathione S-transferase